MCKSDLARIIPVLSTISWDEESGISNGIVITDQAISRRETMRDNALSSLIDHDQSGKVNGKYGRTPLT